MTLIQCLKRKLHQVIGQLPPRDDPRLLRDPDVIHIGRRAFCMRAPVGGAPCIKKVFSTTSVGRRAFRMEKLAQKRFLRYSWFPRWSGSGWHWFARPMFPEETRLDRIAQGLDQCAKAELAARALSIALDLFGEGFAHRDFHAKNLYLVDGQLKVTDFETMVEYPAGQKPSFWESYDLTGQGLESPLNTGHMCFAAGHPCSLSTVMGVTLQEAKERLGTILKEELREASLTFKTSQMGRHTCRSQLIYSSFDVEGLRVPPADGQRHCARRCQRLGLSDPCLSGKRILDLGSNIGGMLFEIQKFHPAECVGLEYDSSKVAVARRVALFCGLNKLRFVQGDIDKLTVRAIDGPYDVVFCMAVEGHVRRKARLYRSLGALTTDTLYFEANGSADPMEAARLLRLAGFRDVEYLGVCDDDCVPENNTRPLFVARKR